MSNNKTIPPRLKRDSRVRIICTARYVNIDDIVEASKVISSMGFRVDYGKTIGQIDNQFGGCDVSRTADLQEALDDPSIEAIWCARGGYGTARLLKSIDFSQFRNNPKWIIGFSDITALHAAIYSHGVVSLHAPMPFGFDKNNLKQLKSLNTTLDYLKGNFKTLSWHHNNLNGCGSATGNMLGGNLSVLYSLRGTYFDNNTTDTLFVIEDIDEYLYHIDRMCTNFDIGNKFKNISGLIIGQFTKMNDNITPFGHTANQIIDRIASLNSVPVRCFDAPFGHSDLNLPFLHGAKATIDLSDESVTLSYHG